MWEFQVVIQRLASSIEDGDAWLATENSLVQRLSNRHEVAGRAAGSGVAEIFVVTNDPHLAFEEIRNILLTVGGGWKDARVAFRKPGSRSYTILWPPELTQWTSGEV